MRLSEKLVRRLCAVWVWLLFTVCVATAQSVAVGYTELKLGGNNVAPAGSAIFSYRNAEGVLVWEAAVAAVRPIKRGRIFVDGGARTGLAIVNPQPAASIVNLSLRDSS